MRATQDRPRANVSGVARLILIRHGESVANAEGRFTRGPHEPLSRRGRQESLERARRLQKRFDPVALYASPFVRALETAQLIGGVLGLAPLVVDALREQDFGELRGQPYETLRMERRTDRWRFRPPGGETLEEVFGRVGPALDEIATRHLGAEIVIVSHGGVMAAVQRWACELRGADPVIAVNCGGYLLRRRAVGYEGPFPLGDDDEP
jgi:broad specificity phosphatase PhoE